MKKKTASIEQITGKNQQWRREEKKHIENTGEANRCVSIRRTHKLADAMYHWPSEYTCRNAFYVKGNERTAYGYI